ncbi:tyrosine-type recombinase/integrase [Falsiroseomonas sp.]|uniref:tyrosine-type recombinase/integrase n=1 Tax=Falsiroseomonas sp. TaxID=2870721 RepID=UPI003565AC5F
MQRVNDDAIDALTIPSGGREAWLSDSTVKGLRVRATSGGAKTFFACWTDKATGERRRHKIGAWGAITLKQARDAARIILGEVAKGRDPSKELARQREAAKARKAEEALTVEALIERWGQHLARNSRRPGYIGEAKRALKQVFAAHLGRPAVKLGKAEVREVFDGMLDAGKVGNAGRVKAYGRAAYGWAMGEELVRENPFAALRNISTKSGERDRVLTDDEVGEVWRAAGTLGHPFGPMIRLLLLTAQRRDEVAGLPWSELAHDHSVWTLPAGRSKNGEEHVVHLAPEAREVLAAVPRINGWSLLFTTTGKTPPSGFSVAKRRLDRAIVNERTKEAQEEGRIPAPLRPFVLHDFRRTCVTWLAQHAGVPPHVADRILNHVEGTIRGVAKVYQRAEFLPERKAALEAWARHVLSCAERREADDKVVALRRA